MKNAIIKNMETLQVTAGIAMLIVAGVVIWWWVLPGAILFGLALLFLCAAIIEDEVVDKRP